MFWSRLKLLAVLVLSSFCLVCPPADGLRILGLFPHPGVSHFHFFHPIMRGLAEAGHNVTVVSHFPEAKPHKNYKDLPLTGLDLLTNAVDLAVCVHCSYMIRIVDYWNYVMYFMALARCFYGNKIEFDCLYHRRFRVNGSDAKE